MLENFQTAERGDPWAPWRRTAHRPQSQWPGECLGTLTCGSLKPRTILQLEASRPCSRCHCHLLPLVPADTVYSSTCLVLSGAACRIHRFESFLFFSLHPVKKKKAVGRASPGRRTSQRKGRTRERGCGSCEAAVLQQHWECHLARETVNVGNKADRTLGY